MIYQTLSDENFRSFGFLKTCHVFRFYTFCLIYPALLDEKILSMGFHMTCHFIKELLLFQVRFSTLFVWYTQLCQTKTFWVLVSSRLVIFSRNWKCFKLCFPHFLYDIPSCVRQKLSKFWFPQDLSYFQISRNCKYCKLCFPPVNILKVLSFLFTCGFSPGLRMGSVQWMKYWLFQKKIEVLWQSWVYQAKTVENIIWNICNSLKFENMKSSVWGLVFFLKKSIVRILSNLLTPFLDLG